MRNDFDDDRLTALIIFGSLILLIAYCTFIWSKL